MARRGAAVVNIQQAMGKRTRRQLRDARLMLSAWRAMIYGRTIRPEARRVVLQQIMIQRREGSLPAEDAEAIRERVNRGWP